MPPPTPGVAGFGKLYFCLCFICYFVIFVNLNLTSALSKLRSHSPTGLSSKSSCFPRMTLNAPFCSCSAPLCLS